jgi:cyclase
MLKKRLIPILLLQNGMLVRSELFKIHQVIGNPIYEVQRFNEWNVDELVYLDITREGEYDLRRDDHKVKGLNDPLGILDAVAKTCFMPLTWGGRISTVSEMRERFSRGADKITINTAAVLNPNLIYEGAKIFGSQAIVISIDVLRQPDGRREIFIDGGRKGTSLNPEDWAREVANLGAGEILLQSIDRDGTGRGCSGVGRYEDYGKGIQAGASAVAAANIWHFKELSDRGGKRAMAKAGIEVRL